MPAVFKLCAPRPAPGFQRTAATAPRQGRDASADSIDYTEIHSAEIHSDVKIDLMAKALTKGRAMDSTRPRSVTIIASLMIAFGFAEIVTGFTHNFFGLHTTDGAMSTYLGASIGACYAAAGFVILTMKRGAPILAMALLLVVVAGRISMVIIGLYPVDTLRQAVAMVLGTAIAAGFAIFIALKRSAFQRRLR